MLSEPCEGMIQPCVLTQQQRVRRRAKLYFVCLALQRLLCKEGLCRSKVAKRIFILCGFFFVERSLCCHGNPIKPSVAVGSNGV